MNVPSPGATSTARATYGSMLQSRSLMSTATHIGRQPQRQNRLTPHAHVCAQGALLECRFCLGITSAPIGRIGRLPGWRRYPGGTARRGGGF